MEMVILINISYINVTPNIILVVKEALIQLKYYDNRTRAELLGIVFFSNLKQNELGLILMNSFLFIDWINFRIYNKKCLLNFVVKTS